MHFLVAMGANLPGPAGSPEANLARALADMVSRGITLRALSRFYRTPCFPAGAGPDFVNAAVLVSADMSEYDLLGKLHAIEAEFGRQRETRWSARSLDLDLIAAGDHVRPDLPGFSAWRDLPLHAQATRAPQELVLPHPRLADRAFVLVPLADVAPDWVHPVSGLTVADMLAALPQDDRAAVRPI